MNLKQSVLLALMLVTSAVHAQGSNEGDACVAEATENWSLPVTFDAAIAMRDALDDVIEYCTPAPKMTPDDTGVLFHAIPNSKINARSCPGTDCERVDQVEGGTAIPIFGVEQDGEDREWYSIDLEESKWIAGWLTRRGPDVVIDIGAFHEDERTGCLVAIEFQRDNRNNMIFALSGRLKGQVLADLYRPGATEPLPVDGQYDKEFVGGGGEAYVQQQYWWNTGYPNGLYRIEIELYGEVSTIGFNKERTGVFWLHVRCEN